MVTMWKPATKTFTDIPRAELAPGMVQAKIEGRPGMVWVNAADVTRSMEGDHKHPPFEGEAREKVVAIMNAVFDVYPRDYDFWEDGFRRDTNAEREIDTWTAIATVYQTHTAGMSLATKDESLKLLLACSNTDPETVKLVFRREYLSYPQYKEIAAAYYETRAQS